MRVKDVAELIRVRTPRISRTDRVLDRCVTIADLRREAHRQWPRGVRGYVDGAADEEVTLGRNRSAFHSFDLIPTALQDVSAPDLSCDILGARSAYPFALGPTGYTRMMHVCGESAVARAARAAGIPYALSTMATTSIEELGPLGGDLWFQLYIWRDRGLARSLVDRARESGYRALILTVDTAVTGLRVRDYHNGFTLPPQLTPSALVDMAAHPRWGLGLLGGPGITFANFPPEVVPVGKTVMQFAAEQFDPSLTWDDVAWLRGVWHGPLVLKGLLSAADARRAIDAGVDALALSNHGGRQLDLTPTPVAIVPEIRDAVGDGLTLFVDSGIRRGSHIAIALARGADACLIGRPYLYGLGAAGERGVAAAIVMLADELKRTMQLLGVTSIAEIRRRGADLVRERRSR